MTKIEELQRKLDFANFSLKEANEKIKAMEALEHHLLLRTSFNYSVFQEECELKMQLQNVITEEIQDLQKQLRVSQLNNECLNAALLNEREYSEKLQSASQEYKFDINKLQKENKEVKLKISETRALNVLLTRRLRELEERI